jgi:hypothetical protein
MALMGVVFLAVAALFVLAPTVYSPTVVYGPIVLGNSTQNQPTYSNWESLSCWATGFGVYYGRTVFQPSDSYQSGCPSPTASLP